MKDANGTLRWVCIAKLYIPHGSDESHQKVVPAEFLDVFISHMVQMKEICLELWQMLLLSLYPTWFRWKRKLRLISIGLRYLFISHMVQMKGHFVTNCISDWFNFISHMVQMKVAVIIFSSIDVSSFISHMVQMKAVKAYNQKQRGFALYPTWFRWKAWEVTVC